MGILARRLMTTTAASTETLFYDTFTGINGTDLTVHTPDIDLIGGGWQNDISNYLLTSNRATPNNTAQVYANVGASNAVITFDLRNPNGGRDAGAVVRWVDANNYWSITLINSTTLRISETTAASTNVRASTTYNYTSGTGTHSFTITLAGSSIEVTVVGTDNSTTSFSSSSHQSATRHGLKGGFGGGFDNAENYTVVG